MSSTIFSTLHLISKKYKIPYRELLEVAGLNVSSQEYDTSIKLQAVVFDDVLYYYNEIDNIVYDKQKKIVGTICPQSYDLVRF